LFERSDEAESLLSSLEISSARYFELTINLDLT